LPFRYLSRRAQTIRAFTSGIGKSAVIIPAAFLASMSWAMLGLGLVFYLREVQGASKSQIGAFYGLWFSGYAVGCLVVRPITDRFRPRYLLVVSCLCASVLPLAILYGGSLFLTCVFGVVMGVSGSLFWPPLAGWLSSELEGADLGKVMSRFNLAWSTGAIIGPLLGGWLSERAAALPVYSASVLSLLTAVLIAGAAVALPRVRGDPYTAIGNGAPHAAVGRATRLRYSAWVGVFTAYCVLGMLAAIFPVSAKEDLGIGKSVIGLLVFSQALCRTAGFGILGHTTFWHYRGSQMLLPQLGILGCLVAMIYAGRPLTIAPVLGLIGLLGSLSYFNSMFHGIAGSSNRAARSALHESLLGVGHISGAVLGGVLYQHYSVVAAYLTCAAIVVVGVAAQAVISIWAKRVEGAPW